MKSLAQSTLEPATDVPARERQPQRRSGLPNARKQQDEGEERWSIGALAKQLGVTTRTIRFYEASGLLMPERKNGVRFYGRRDRARMQLILRGKNLGFSLEDIRDYLRLYDDDPSQVTQVRMLLGKLDDAIGGLEHKKRDLERTLAELRELKRRAENFLTNQS